MFKLIAVLILILILILINTNSYASQCKVDQVKLQVLGSGGPEIDDGRSSSGYLIWYKNKARVLIDTGTGSSVKFYKKRGNV